MSRSRKRTPITGVCPAFSEKDDKRRANRRLRTRVSRILYVTANGNQDPDDLSLPLLREVSNVWGFAKDGKVYNFPDSWRLPHGLRDSRPLWATPSISRPTDLACSEC